MGNPFAFVRSVVTGNRFIGRREMLDSLESLVEGNASVNIIGLPRMGKTSLVKHCFLIPPHFSKWVCQYQILPVYLSLNTQSNAKGMWGGLAGRFSMALSDVLQFELTERGQDLEALIDSLDCVVDIPSEDDRFTRLESLVSKLKRKTGLRPVFILDELDSLMRYSFSPVTLSRLRNLGGDCSIVTCSRRHPDVIEQNLGCKPYFSNASTEMYVGLFSEQDAAEYWSHFAYAFDFLDSKMFRQYRELLDRYVGRHPMLMSSMNYYVFQQDAALLKKWGTTRSVTDRQSIEREIRADVHDTLEKQIAYVEEQGLKDTAVRLVVGGMGKPDSNKQDSLLRYQFIREVSSLEKREVFGYDLGFRDGDIRYMCFSDFSSHQMVDMFEPPMDGYELLKETETRLRQLVRVRLADLVDEDPFGEVVGEDGFIHERWEDPFQCKFQTWVEKLSPAARDDKLARMRKSFDEMLSVWDKRVSNDIKPSHESDIDIVSSSTLGQLWYVFIEWQWKDFFAEVLADAPCYKRSAEAWFQAVFLPILRWRNAVYHFNDEEWTEESVARSKDCCNAVCRAVRDWMERKV